jgi:hypothetical protein
MLVAQGARLTRATVEAYTMQYGEIFGITAIVCVVGAILGLLISGKSEHADEPDSAPTQAFDAPTQAVGKGRHRPG